MCFLQLEINRPAISQASCQVVYVLGYSYKRTFNIGSLLVFLRNCRQFVTNAGNQIEMPVISKENFK